MKKLIYVLFVIILVGLITGCSNLTTKRYKVTEKDKVVSYLLAKDNCTIVNINGDKQTVKENNVLLLPPGVYIMNVNYYQKKYLKSTYSGNVETRHFQENSGSGTVCALLEEGKVYSAHANLIGDKIFFSVSEDTVADSEKIKKAIKVGGK